MDAEQRDMGAERREMGAETNIVFLGHRRSGHQLTACSLLGQICLLKTHFPSH